MPITRAQIGRQLHEGLHAVFGLEYDRYPEEWPEIFEKGTSTQASEEELKLSGFGTAPVKPEGSAVLYDTAGEAWMSRYVHETISMAYAITEEAFDDNLYIKHGERHTKALAFSMKNTKEVKAASILNFAFTSGYTGGDGKVLLATDHPLVSGGVNSNRLTTGADLSETSLENAIIQMGEWNDERGIKIRATAKKLIVGTANQFAAERILGNPNRPGTADHDINALHSMGAIPGGWAVNHYLTDPNAWYLITTVMDGLKMFQRKKVKFEKDGDFETGNFKFKASERYSFGWSDPLSVFGTPGVS